MEEVSIMNEPIISPWFFYAMSMADKLEFFFLLVTGVLGIASFFGIIVFFDDSSSSELKSDCKRVWTAFFIFCFISIFVPSSNTITKMIIAQKITPANVQMFGDGAEKAVDKIIEKIINYQKKLEEKK